MTREISEKQSGKSIHTNNCKSETKIKGIDKGIKSVQKKSKVEFKPQGLNRKRTL